MLDAMKAVQDGSVHGVPKTSLHNRSRIKGKIIHEVKSGHKQYVSAEEAYKHWIGNSCSVSMHCIHPIQVYIKCAFITKLI